MSYRVTRAIAQRSVDAVNRTRGPHKLTIEYDNPGDGGHYHLNTARGHNLITGSAKQIHEYAEGIRMGFEMATEAEAEHANGYPNTETYWTCAMIDNTARWYERARTIGSEARNSFSETPTLDAADRIKAWIELTADEVRTGRYLAVDEKFNQEKRDLILQIGSLDRVDWRTVAQHYMGN